MSSLDHLNPVQKEAVLHFGTPLLILAGAGSGKTRVLTHKIVHMVENNIFAPQNILAVTFTNKAAREMKNRISTMMPPHLAYPLWISTFHSLGVQILRRYHSALEYKPGFSIFDDSDQQSVIKKVLKALNINEKVITPKFCQSRINMVKSMCLTPAQMDEQKHLFSKEFTPIYKAYERELKANNAFDFGDLISKSVFLIEQFPEIRAELQNTFKYVMVDEYQDTNPSQYRMMQGLCGDKNNVAVVGDEDQSIYAWRGADITNILNFEKDFPNSKTIKLEENYRSTKNIIAAAYGVIKNNSQRHDKKLFTSNAEGDKVKVVEVENEYEEGKFVADQVYALQSAGYSLDGIAIFYRTNAQSRVIEEQLRNRQIPYRLYGGMRFYDRKEIKDVASYLNLILNPTDDVSFKRIINVPARSLGKTTIDALEQISIDNQCSMIEASIKAVQTKAVTPRAVKQLTAFLDLMVKLREENKNLDVYSLYTEVLHQTGYLKQLELDDTVESQSRIENLQEFGNAILRFTETHQDEATLEKFLSDMALISDADQDEQQGPSVTMMTLHISKGLEFPYVFMIGMEDGLFPSAQSLEDNVGNKLEEERRLCYVGMTRAEKSLFMLHARSRRHWGDPKFNPHSRFLDEIPAELVETVSFLQRRPSFMSRGAYGGGGVGGGSWRKPTRSSDDSFDAFPDYENQTHSDEASPFQKGRRVRHPVFGAGFIYQVEGTGENLKVAIQFGDQSIKKFIAKHANLTFI